MQLGGKVKDTDTPTVPKQTVATTKQDTDTQTVAPTMQDTDTQTVATTMLPHLATKLGISDELLQEISQYAVIAGGAIIYDDQYPKVSHFGDVDLFVLNSDTNAYHKLVKLLVENIDINRCERYQSITNIITSSNCTYQIVLSKYKTPQNLIDSFDIDVVKCGFYQCKRYTGFNYKGKGDLTIKEFISGTKKHRIVKLIDKGYNLACSKLILDTICMNGYISNRNTEIRYNEISASDALIAPDSAMNNVIDYPGMSKTQAAIINIEIKDTDLSTKSEIVYKPFEFLSRNIKSSSYVQMKINCMIWTKFPITVRSFIRTPPIKQWQKTTVFWKQNALITELARHNLIDTFKPYMFVRNRHNINISTTNYCDVKFHICQYQILGKTYNTTYLTNVISCNNNLML